MSNAPREEIDYQKEAAEVAQMKAECDRLIQEAFAQIDELLEKIDDILSRETTETTLTSRGMLDSSCSQSLPLDELDVLMRGTQKLVP